MPPSSDNSSEFRHDITADPSKFEAGMRQAAQAASNASKEIDAQFKKIGDAVSAVNKYVMGFAAVLAGGGALKKFINDANEWNATAGKMSAQLGVTSQQASVLNVALQRLGIDSDTYLSASQKLSKQIQSNGQAFDVLGVSVRDATGAYRPVTEVMGEVNEKLAAIKNPIEQNIAGQQVYGKGWAEVRAILKLTADQMAAAEVRARQLNLIVGPEGVAMSKQYQMQMRDLGLVGKSLEVQFGNALLPVFTRMGAFLGGEGPKMGQVFARVLEGIGFAAAATWLALKDMGDAIGAMAAQAAALLSGDIAGFKAIGRARDEEAAKNEAAYERLKEQFGKPLGGTDMPAAPDLTKGPRYTFAKEGTDPAQQSRMSEWEATLAQQKAALERGFMQQGQFREMNKAEELNYWREISTTHTLTQAERVALARKTAEVEMALIREGFELRVKALQTEAEQYKANTDERLRIERQIQSHYTEGTAQYEESAKRIAAIQRQAAEQAATVADSRVQAERQARLQLIALEEQSAQQAAALGLITQAQLLQSESAFESRRHEIAAQALLDRLQLAERDPDRNPVEIERIHREIEALEQQHQLRMGQLKGGQQLEQLKGPIEVFRTAEQALVSAGTAMLTNWKSVGQQITGVFRTIGTSLIQELIVKPAALRVIAFARERAMAIFGIGADAAKAGAGAAAATSNVPIIGPELALASMATVFASVSAMAGKVPSFSAAGGFDIPGTLAPLIQAHPREMVLPAKYADAIRAMAERPAPAAPEAPLAMRVVPMPGDFWLVHRHDILKATQRATRDQLRR